MALKHLRKTYQIKISLIESKPPIWRTILVPSDIDLGSLHIVFQISLGWTNSHMHQFISGRTLFGIQDDELDFGMETENENEYTISQLLLNEKDTIKYEYDFGDGWTHKIVLEKISPFETKAVLPVCIRGKRACPPEDCGGIWGYYNLMEALQDPAHPEHEDMLEWVGEEFDPEVFNLKEINRLLKEYCG